MVLFVAGIAAILALTLKPIIDLNDMRLGDEYVWPDLLLGVGRVNWMDNVNLTPILPLFKQDGFLINTDHSVINVVGNMAMFAPVGFLASALFRKATFKRALLVGFGFSFFIEFCQYFIGRIVDVNDLILNTTGAICGYLLYLLCRRIWPNFVKKFSCAEME